MAILNSKALLAPQLARFDRQLARAAAAQPKSSVFTNYDELLPGESARSVDRQRSNYQPPP